MAEYVVVPIADSELMRVGFGMLYAEKYAISYPMPGPTLYIWDPAPSADGTEAAFGPLDSLGGPDIDFGEWCLGRTIATSLGTLTVPSESQELDPSWFAPPPDPPEPPVSELEAILGS